jgi:hypothetical protein
VAEQVGEQGWTGVDEPDRHVPACRAIGDAAGAGQHPGLKKIFRGARLRRVESL